MIVKVRLFVVHNLDKASIFLHVFARNELYLVQLVRPERMREKIDLFNSLI